MGSADLTARLQALQQRPQRPEQHSAEADDDAVAVDGWKPLLPEEWYEAKYLGHETALVFNAAKVFMHFEIVQHGEHMGKRLFRAFRARKLIGRPRKGGKFVAHSNGELYQTLARLLDVKLRADRITFRPLRQMLFRIKTRTVRTDHKQREIPEQSRYSVIDEIEREQ